MIEKCPHCGKEFYPANRVSIYGMYDMCVFHPISGTTVDEVIQNWMVHIANPTPANVYGKEVDDMGPSYLCPVIVLHDHKELRRVGKGIHPNSEKRKPSQEDVEVYRQALLDDPDIPRLLAAGN